MGLFRKTPKPEAFERGRVYDYSTAEGRVATAEWLFAQAKNERAVREAEWRRQNDYYNFAHDAAMEAAEALAESDLTLPNACIPDPWIMVESQIDPDVPRPEFHGRDDDLDSAKAKQRELAVRYLIEENRLGDKNTSNERRLRKLGDAFWKAYWDETMPCGDRKGNIRVIDVAPQDIYPDPMARELQDGEYVFYVYTLHKLKFWRLYHDELTGQGKTLDDLTTGGGYREQDDILEPYTQSTAARDDLVQVMEFWYKQPFDAASTAAPADGAFHTPSADAKGVKAGAIGCSIQAGGVELKNIPNYWEKTGGQCELFPFVHYWCIRDETQFWNKSELEPILPLVDAADRELLTGLFNDAMMANDIILMEEGALAPGEEFSNVPGAVVRVNQGRGNGVARLGGLSDGVKCLSMVGWLMEQIQRTNRNYDSNNGRETSRVTTASGLLQLRSDAQAQTQIKAADRNAGFCRLYELLDWLALEFFDDDRLLFIGAKDDGDEAEAVVYNGANYARTTPALYDPMTGEEVRPEQVYYPRVDVTVSVGKGLDKSPAATVEILNALAAAQVTEDNWKILAAELDYLDIPQKQDIISDWQEKFEPKVPREITEALESDPALVEMTGELIAMRRGNLPTAFGGPPSLSRATEESSAAGSALRRGVSGRAYEGAPMEPMTQPMMTPGSGIELPTM